MLKNLKSEEPQINEGAGTEVILKPSFVHRLLSRFIVDDMTRGNPYKLLTKFSVPLLIGNIFQQLYNTVDSIVVGQFSGHKALAAVGNGFPFILLLS